MKQGCASLMSGQSDLSPVHLNSTDEGLTYPAGWIAIDGLPLANLIRAPAWVGAAQISIR
jgi:hypothetical protein